MKNKEKEKFWYKVIKETGKKIDWRFKSYFIFKQKDNLFFSVTFFINPKINELNGWLGFKPFLIDNVFWEIIDEKKNKEMPLSFRGEAAFCVRELMIKNYKIIIADELKPENDIAELIKEIEKDAQEKKQSVSSLSDFINEMLQNEEQHTVGIITGLIEQGLFGKALSKISEYKSKNYSSGFGFDNNKDFYDLAREYCEKKLSLT